MRCMHRGRPTCAISSRWAFPHAGPRSSRPGAEPSPPCRIASQALLASDTLARVLEGFQIDRIALGKLLGGLLAPGPQHVVYELNLVRVTHPSLVVHRRLPALPLTLSSSRIVRL